MSRFTRNDLEHVVNSINADAAKLGSVYTLQSGGRNGYTGLDLYRNKVCERNIKCGTPRECSAAAYEWLADIAVDVALTRPLEIKS